MSRNRTLVSIYSSTSDSDVAATAEIDMGPYISAGLRSVKGVWVTYDQGAGTDTDHTYDCKFQESASTADTDFADITGGAFTQVLDGSEGLSILNLTVTKRYLRAYLTMGGTVASAFNFVGVIVIPRFDT